MQTLQPLQPIPVYDPVDILLGLWRTIEYQRGEFERICVLTSRDFDRWIKILNQWFEPTMSAVFVREDQEWLEEKLGMLVQRLQREKSQWATMNPAPQV